MTGGPRKVPSCSEPVVASGLIDLSPEEETLFAAIREAVKASEMVVEPRVAGGWVRDKILGLPSDDIDIALDTCAGVEFATMLQRFLESKGEETSSLGVIKCNPDQSKHLETATIRMYGFDIDLVNLRTETYTQDSRIPEMSFGTPTEDAYRRDLTVNALFYNVATGQVEDFTRHGLSDLQNGIIRTPLAPRETYLDDPLRPLRLVRFATRLNYRVASASWAALADPEVHEALGSKVSRERVGVEIWKSVCKGPRPVAAMASFVDRGMYPVLFGTDLPHAVVGEGIAPLDAMARVHHVTTTTPVLSELLGGDAVPQLRLAACVSQLHCVEVPNPEKKSRMISAAVASIAYSLKLSKAAYKAAEVVLENAPKFQSMAETLASGGTVSRVEVGLAVRSAGALWGACLSYAGAMELKTPEGVMDVYLSDISASSDLESGANAAPLSSDATHADEAATIKGFWGTPTAALGLLSHIRDLDATEVWKMKPIVTGKDIMGTLGIRGPAVRDALTKVVAWQLEFPQGTKEECLAFMSSSK